MDALETAILCVLWHKILQRFHSTSKSLQRVDMSLESCLALYNRIESFASIFGMNLIQLKRMVRNSQPLYRKPMRLKTNATEKRRKLLIMMKRTLDALQLWKMLVNLFVLELTFQSLLP